MSILVDVGHFAHKGETPAASEGYALRLGLVVQGSVFVDGDDTHDPYAMTSTPPGDEPCRRDPFDLFAYRVNGQPIGIVQGRDAEPCVGEATRFIDILPQSTGDPKNVLRIPTEFVHEGLNEIELQSLAAPFTHPLASTSDGWAITVEWAQLELVAPPVFLIHGFDPTRSSAHLETPEVNCLEEPDDWCKLARNIPLTALVAFGQNPWQWDGAGGSLAVVPFRWNGKQAVNASVDELQLAADALTSQLGYRGHPDLVGHSTGGLIAKAMQVRDAQREGSPDTSRRIVTFATPHRGSPMADFYTCHVVRDYYWTNIASRPQNQPLLQGVLDGDCVWRDYYALGGNSGILGAYRYPSSCRDASDPSRCVAPLIRGCGDRETQPCVAPPNDRLVEFQLKADGPSPGTPNPFTEWLEEAYDLATGDDPKNLFAVAGNCGTGGICDLNEFWSLHLGGTYIADQILDTDHHDFVVPYTSALDLGAGHPAALCTGRTFSHTAILAQPEAAPLALAGLGGKYDDPYLRGAYFACQLIGT